MSNRWIKEFDRVDEFLGNQDFEEITYKFLGDNKYILICKSLDGEVSIKRRGQ